MSCQRDKEQVSEWRNAKIVDLDGIKGVHKRIFWNLTHGNGPTVRKTKPNILKNDVQIQTSNLPFM